MQHHPHYWRVLKTFVRNSLVREMAFRANFVLEIVTRAFWFAAQLVLFDLIYRNVPTINGWSRYEFLAFLATGMIINTLIEAFFMPNCANFSELIRTGNLDFVLLKPIDTQFLISFEKLDLGTLSHLLLSGSLLAVSVVQLGQPVDGLSALLYLLLIAASVAFFYSLMVILASTSVWFGRNQGLYDFWFYITIFARYPREIYAGSPAGDALRVGFTYVLPILLVVTVPVQTLIDKALQPSWLTALMVFAAGAGLIASRIVFQWALRSYRSASS
jgi:ABC-2 type transport system permease protein